MRHAVLIGSATFDPDSGIEPLRYPAKDVADLESLIRTDDFKFDKITQIIDQSKQFVEETLDEILLQSSFHDFLLIYFSGHGKLNSKGDLFLSCRNTKERSLNSTGFRYRYLMDLLSAHDAERVAIILDCCYAGKAIAGFKGSPSEQIHSLLDSGRGIFILAASGATQTAQEREADGNGIFTKQVIEGLRTGAADIDGDGEISLNDLARYVRDEFRRKNVMQEPVVGNYARSGDFILGSNRRLRHQRLLAATHLKFEQSKGLFEKATRRAIEDYLDDIIESPDACEDARFKALSAFEMGGSLERVIETFRSEARERAELETKRQRAEQEARQRAVQNIRSTLLPNDQGKRAQDKDFHEDIQYGDGEKTEPPNIPSQKDELLMIRNKLVGSRQLFSEGMYNIIDGYLGGLLFYIDFKEPDVDDPRYNALIAFGVGAPIEALIRQFTTIDAAYPPINKMVDKTNLEQRDDKKSRLIQSLGDLAEAFRFVFTKRS